MTSIVKVQAHCSDDKEVFVRVFNAATEEVREEFVLQNGEQRDLHIYDDLAVLTHERRKDCADIADVADADEASE